MSTRAPNAPPDADAPNAAGLNAALRTELGTLAWLSIDDGLARGAWLSELAARQPMALDLRAVSPALREHGGCFVTLHRSTQSHLALVKRTMLVWAAFLQLSC